MRTAGFDSICNVYGENDRVHPVIGSRIEEAHPRAFGYSSTAVMCQVKAPVLESHVGIVSLADFSVQHVTKDLVDGNDFSLIGAIGGNAEMGQFVWVVVQGIWTIQVLDGAAQDAVLYTSANAGVLDDASRGQSRIRSMFLMETRSGGEGPALAWMNYSTDTV